jgi:hypothetical protein
MTDLVVTIQSAHRPHHVEGMLRALYPRVPTWYVPLAEVPAYAEAGAVVAGVEGQLPMKPKQLNAALDAGFAKTYGTPSRLVVTMDDDFVAMRKLVLKENGKPGAEAISLNDAIDLLAADLMERDYYLAGIAGSTNPFFAKNGNSYHGMITGQLLVHKEDPLGLRFDENLKMLEDLDFILQHHTAYGGLVKNRSLLPEFHIFGRSARTDKKYEGGYKPYRTEEVQEETLAYLKSKFPHPAIVFENQGLGKSVQRKINFKAYAKRNENNQKGKVPPNTSSRDLEA